MQIGIYSDLEQLLTFKPGESMITFAHSESACMSVTMCPSTRPMVTLRMNLEINITSSQKLYSYIYCISLAINFMAGHC